MKVFSSRGIGEHFSQLIHRGQRLVVDEDEVSEILCEFLIVGPGDGDLPELESVSIDVPESLFLFLNRLLESTHSLRLRDVDQKDTLGFLAEDPAVELECGRHLTTVQ
jgi:hypothetical protein